MTLPQDLVTRIESVLSQETDDFEELARAAGLDPAVDFRRVCLKGIDLAGCDLRAFDFFESDLRGANLSNATICHNALQRAVTTGANLAGLIMLSIEDAAGAAYAISGDVAPDLTAFPVEILEAIARSLEKSINDLSRDDLRYVTHLDLDRTSVTDLTPLAGLANLVSLNLNGTPVADLAPLAGLANLQLLTLDGTQVADLAPLAGLAKLQILYLGGTPVSDLSPLAKLAKLQILYLAGTQVSDEQIATLQAALPKLEIELQHELNFG